MPSRIPRSGIKELWDYTKGTQDHLPPRVGPTTDWHLNSDGAKKWQHNPRKGLRTHCTCTAWRGQPPPPTPQVSDWKRWLDPRAGHPARTPRRKQETYRSVRGGRLVPKEASAPRSPLLPPCSRLALVFLVRTSTQHRHLTNKIRKLKPKSNTEG